MKKQYLFHFCRALILLLTFSFLNFQEKAFAQTQISGKVKDIGNEPIPGVSVRLKGTANGTTTDVNGEFKLSIPQNQGILVISSIGFTTIEIPLDNRREYNFTLAEDNKFLNEVVVTALGIKREEKSLGFAAQTITADAVVDAKTNNWINSLSGKVAGLNIQGTGAGPMGSSRITLRGESSLNLDNNQALIVVDGVPISSRITGTGFNSHLSQDAPVDYGSGVSDINPDDIETVTVLKGPGATALYGSRAAGGVIIITTKRGKNSENVQVTFSSVTSLSYNPKQLDMLNSNDFKALVKSSGNQNWIKLLDTVNNTNWQNQVFRTAIATDNNLSITGGKTLYPYRFSVGNLSQQGILKTGSLNRTSVAFNVTPAPAATVTCPAPV